MDNPLLDLAAFVLTYLIFGVAGYPLAGRFKRPVAPGTWIAIAVAVVILGFSGRGEVWLLAADGFRIYLVNAVQAVVIGLFAGLFVREIRSKRRELSAQ